MLSKEVKVWIGVFMKSKRSKLRKLEKERYSVLTSDLETCYICGNRKQHIHEVFEGRNRQKSMIYGFCLPLCFQCHYKIHNDREMAIYYKKICQKEFEKKNTREEFIKIFRRNYL